MKLLMQYTAAALVGGLSLLAGQTVALAAESLQPAPSPPPAAPAQPIQESVTESAPALQATPSSTSPNPSSVSQTPPVTCPPGQFPSAFPDVLPTDWAYEAVNRLASLPIRCFPLPTSPVR